MKINTAQFYDASKSKKALNIIRIRPGQFVGDFLWNEYHSGAMNLLREIVGNSLDEAAAGHCSQII